MDANAKKTALRMIPYGLYVLTAADKSGSRVAAATVNWVTQVAFEPPLVVVGVKTDSHAHPLIKETKAFALNVLGRVSRPWPSPSSSAPSRRLSKRLITPSSSAASSRPAWPRPPTGGPTMPRSGCATSATRCSTEAR